MDRTETVERIKALEAQRKGLKETYIAMGHEIQKLERGLQELKAEKKSAIK